MRISKHTADRLGEKVRVNLCGWLRIWSADCCGSKKYLECKKTVDN